MEDKEVIQHSAFLEYCPTCGESLSLTHQLGNDHKGSQCKSCNYFEPSGNCKFLTFLSTALAEYTLLQNVDTVIIQGNEFNVHQAMAANGLLPLFVERAHQIRTNYGTINIPDFELNLRTVEDKDGLLKARVILDEHQPDILHTMAFLSEVIHETMKLTQEYTPQAEYYESEMILDHMPNLSDSVSLNQNADISLNQAIIAATKQMSL